MKPWAWALAGFALVAAAAVGDMLLLTESWVRNGYWAYVPLAIGQSLAGWAVVKKRSVATISLAVLASFAVAGYSAVRFISTPASPPAVNVSQDFPDFALQDQNGRTVTLGELRRDGPVVVVLFRGRW